MPASAVDTVAVGVHDSTDSAISSSPSHQNVNNDGLAADKENISKEEAFVLDTELNAPPYHDDGTGDKETRIVTGADAAKYLLPLRDDGEPSLTFRCLFLASVLSCFQAVMTQIYYVS